MSTRPKIPPPSVPIVDASGACNIEWRRFFSQLPQVGEVATTATGGAATLPANPVGFHTQWINGEEKKVPHYNP